MATMAASDGERLAQLAEKARATWRQACAYDDVDPGGAFIIFSDENPYERAAGEASIAHRRFCEVVARVKACQERGGFLTPQDVTWFAEHDRLRLLLVRCSCGRFLSPAQDVQRFVDLVEEGKKEYVRDVSLPAEGMLVAA